MAVSGSHGWNIAALGTGSKAAPDRLSASISKYLWPYRDLPPGRYCDQQCGSGRGGSAAALMPRRLQNQADQNRVSSPPTIARPPGTPDRSKNQNTAEKNHWFSAGASSTTSRIRNPNCLAGSSARWVAGLRCGSSAREAVQPGNRQQIEHQRGHLKEAQERHAGPEHRVIGVEEQPGRAEQHDSQHQVGERPGQADDAALARRHEPGAQIDRTAGQADAAQRDEQQGQARWTAAGWSTSAG